MKKTLTPQEREWLSLAEAIATRAHAGQVDKCGVPYIEHPRTVSAYCESPEARIAGLLHDVVEDTEVTLEDLKRAGFPEPVLEAVRLVTKFPGYDEDEYYAAIKANPIAREVKLADLKHNTDPARVPKDADEALQKQFEQKHEQYREHIRYLTEE